MTLARAWWIAPLALFAIIAGAVFLFYRAATPSAEDRARAVLAEQVRDPGSLQLRNVREVANGGICGEINARNGFGGYAGFSRFYLVGSFVTVEDEAAMPDVIGEQCD